MVGCVSDLEGERTMTECPACGHPSHLPVVCGVLVAERIAGVQCRCGCCRTLEESMKRTREYRESLMEDLRDPREAEAYLTAARADSPEMFLEALQDVADSGVDDEAE